MIAISFGQSCFNEPCGEQNIILVTAPKKDYSSMDEFVWEALSYLDSDDGFADDWRARYDNRTNSEAKEEELEWMLSGQITDPDHCNFTRQSILYILKQQEPNSKFDVEILETVLRGAKHCRFRITKN